MPIDPSIILSQKPMQPIDPLAAMTKAAQYRNLISEGHLRDQQIQNDQLEGGIKRRQLEAADRDVADQQTFQQALAANNGDFGAALKSVAGKINPKYQAAVEKAHFDAVESRSKSSREELADENGKLQAIGGNIEAILQSPPEARPAMYAEAYQALANDPRLGEMAKGHLPMNYDEAKLTRLRWMGQAQEKINESALKTQDQRNKDAAEGRSAALAVPQLTEAQAKATSAEQKATGTEPIQPLEQIKLNAEEAKAAQERQKLANDDRDFLEKVRHNRAEEGLAGARLSTDRELTKLLSPIEAATLQVPYGTTREQAKGKMPSTQAQGVVAAYASRMAQASEEIERLGKELGTGERVYNFLTPNFFNTATGQQFDQAQRDFINAVLRRESGAVISKSEFDNAYKQYIPRAGDSAGVLKQKADNRAIQFAAFKRAAGNAYQDPKAILGEVDPAFKAYADKYFGGDIEKAKAHNKK